MNTTHPSAPVVPRGERYLALAGAIACVAVTVIIWRNVNAYQGMWPLPGLYFVEVAGLGVVSAALMLRGNPAALDILWGTVGVLGAFCFLSMFSVGLIYFPVLLMFFAAAIASAIRNRDHLLARLVVCLASGLAQAALMLAAIRLLYPL